VALVTIAVSVYVYPYSGAIASRLERFLEIFERAEPRPAEDVAGHPPDVIVLGLGRYGDGIVEGLRERGVAVLGVDYDPVALADWSEQGSTSSTATPKTLSSYTCCRCPSTDGS
jgi:voltage-gated potassium channel Kch